MKNPCWITALAALCAGCETDQANRYYASQKYPPRQPQEVEVLTNAPVKPFVEIADFQSRRTTPAVMRKRAADIGADAVIVTTLGGYYSTSESWAAHDTHAQSYSRIIATAIKYKD